jgi:nitrate/nitrite transporter NarK
LGGNVPEPESDGEPGAGDRGSSDVRSPIRWRLILSIIGLTGIGGGSVAGAVLVTSDYVAGGLVGTATTCAAGLGNALGKLIDKD